VVAVRSWQHVGYDQDGQPPRRQEAGRARLHGPHGRALASSPGRRVLSPATTRPGRPPGLLRVRAPGTSPLAQPSPIGTSPG
jgi:hypothetical protein